MPDPADPAARIAAGDKDDLVALIGEAGAVAALTPEQQVALAKHRSVDVPRALAQHAQHLSPEAIRVLAKSRIFTARRNLAKSGGANLPADVLELLADDEDDVVRKIVSAVWTPDPSAASGEAVERRAAKVERVAMIAAAESLNAKDLAAIVKGRSKSELLALVDNPALLAQCSDQQQVAIASHRSVEVPRALARHAAMLCPEAVRAIAEGRIFTARRALVRHAGATLPPEVRDLLREDEDEVVRKLVADLGDEHAERAATTTAAAHGDPALAKAANKGDVEAMAALGLAAWEARELDSAKTWLAKAAKKGDVVSMLDLETIALEAGDAEEAGTWLEAAAKAGHPGARLRLGAKEPERPSLTESDLSERDLRRRDYRRVDLSAARFDRSVLREATFQDAGGAAASFLEADLTAANLRSVRFTDVDFSGARFGELDSIVDAVGPMHARLCDAEFIRCCFEKCDFERTDFTDARFVDCSFDGASFSLCDLTTAEFNGVSMRESEFFECEIGNLPDVNATDCVLDETEAADKWVTAQNAMVLDGDPGAITGNTVLLGDPFSIHPPDDGVETIDLPAVKGGIIVAEAIDDAGIFAGRPGVLEDLDPARCTLEYATSIAVDAGSVAVLSPKIRHPGVIAHWDGLRMRSEGADSSDFALRILFPGADGYYACYRVRSGRAVVGVLIATDEQALREAGWPLPFDSGDSLEHGGSDRLDTVAISGAEIAITGVELIGSQSDYLTIPVRRAAKGKPTRYVVERSEHLAVIRLEGLKPPQGRRKLVHLGDAETESWGLAVIDPGVRVDRDDAHRIVEAGPLVSPGLIDELFLSGEFAEVALPGKGPVRVYGAGRKPYAEIVLVAQWEATAAADYEVPVDHLA